MGNNHTFLLPNGCFQYIGDRVSPEYTCSTNYVTYSENAINFRKGVRNTNFVIDRELYDGGFSDAENVGWVCLFSVNV